jgi:hypothetical protein
LREAALVVRRHTTEGGRATARIANGGATLSCNAGGARYTMTENERRNADVLTREDVIVRVFSVVALVSLFLLILLMVNP